jgi:hypothetical protein
MSSRYTTYQNLIDDISAEAGEDEGALDALILNLLKAVVDQLNLRRSEFRQAVGTIAVSANDYDYSLASVLSDFMELVDDENGIRNSSGVPIPLARNRAEFVDTWRPASEFGTPTLARIFANTLYLRPTPSAADTLTVEYYKRLATPTAEGTVLVPDEYIGLLRARISERLEAYLESDTFAAKQSVMNKMEADLIRALNREEAYKLLPSSVVSEE